MIGISWIIVFSGLLSLITYAVLLVVFKLIKKRKIFTPVKKKYFKIGIYIGLIFGLITYIAYRINVGSPCAPCDDVLISEIMLFVIFFIFSPVIFSLLGLAIGWKKKDEMNIDN